MTPSFILVIVIATTTPSQDVTERRILDDPGTCQLLLIQTGSVWFKKKGFCLEEFGHYITRHRITPHDSPTISLLPLCAIRISCHPLLTAPFMGNLDASSGCLGQMCPLPPLPLAWYP